MKKAYQRFIAMLIVISISMSVVLPTRNVTYAAADDEDEANLFETAISRFLMIGGLSLYALVGIATGPAENADGSAAPLTIESLFFNKYDKTRLALFGDSAGENSLLADETENGLKARVNDVFSFFTKLAVIVYMLMLVYIGIRILLNAGTEKNAKYKEFLVYWVQGVAILFLFPYVIKYTILINNAFVEFIAENKDNIGAVTELAKPAGITSPSDGSGSMGGLTTFIDTAKQFLTDGTDYMSVMFKKGWDEGWLVYALCFLVMVKQLITLIIIYFKRLLITIFLIAIFPLVTVSYAIDKLGDGKSQAFGNWVKEFILNVFIQSFHAIVYVIGMALIVRIGESADVADSWLLIVILITFISKGDDLLKNIFNVKGGGGDTVQGIGKTALQTKGAIKLAQDGASLVSRTVGRESKLAEFGHHAAGYAGAARDYASAYMDASNAALSEELFPAPAPATSGQPTTRIDPSTIESNLSEDRKQEILSEMLSILDIEDETERDQKLEEFKKTLEEDPDALQFVEALLKVGAAGAAATVTGDLEVNLDQRIEIILEQMKNGKLAGNKDLINKLRMANEVKFKRPEQAVLMSLRGRRANAGGRRANEGTRRKGDRYSGVFTQSTGAKTGNATSTTVAGGVKTGLRYKIARTTANTINRVKATNKIIGMEKKAVKDVRALRRIERQLRNKNLTAAERAKLENKRKKLQSGRTLQALRAQRESYAAQGIYFVGIGRTQRTLNRIAGRDAAWKATKTTVSSTWKAVSGTGDRIKNNRAARRAAKEAVKLKQKRFKEGRLSHTETNRLIEAEKLVNRHARERGHGRMTVAQRRLNRGTNRLAVQEARKANDLRKQADMHRRSGNIKDANKLDLEAMKLEKRVMNTRGRTIKGTKLRRATRAQRILDRNQQSRSLEQLKEIRSKSPDRLTDAEKKILERSNKMRSELRDKGVLLRNGSRVEREYNSAGKMTRKQELQALGTVVGARATMAGKMVGDRIFGGKMGDYTAERKRIEDASNSLRKRGIIIRDSRTINSLDRKTADFRHHVDTKDERKAARQDLRARNKTTLGEMKSIEQRRKAAEAEIRRAGRDAKRARGNAVELQRARDREKAAMDTLKSVQADTDALARQHSAQRKQLRERGIVLSNMNFALNRNKRIEEKINRTTATSYQTALRREMAADRRLERADIAVQRTERQVARQERREARTDRIIDSATKIKLSPIRQLAEVQQAKREASRADRESAMATKLSEVMSRQQFARESSEAAALHRSVSQSSIQSNNIATGTTSFGNRFMNATSQGFHDFVTTPERMRTSVETFVSDTGASVRDKIASAKQMATKVGEGAADVWSTVSKPGELVSAVRAEVGTVSHETPPTISPEIAELAARRKADNVIKITKVHTSPPEESSTPKGSTPSSERETVVVIRDSDESFAGSLSGKNVLSVNSQKDYDRAKKLAADAKAEVAAATSKAGDTTSTPSKSGEPSSDDKMMRTATMLAASIVAINQSSNGDYTAAEIVAHIDSIKSIMKDQTPGTPEYDVCANLLTKLKYNLDDYESNVRIQVLNDPSLIDSADPRREGIIDSSISHVKSLPSDDVLLSMLRYEPGELQEGYTPIARTAKAYNSVASFVATGIATGYQEPEVQGAFSAGLRDRYRQSQQEAAEKAMDQARATMRKEAGAMLTSGLEAAVDLTVGAPIAIGLGVMGAGAGSAGKGSSTLQAGLSGMGTYAVANKGYEGAKTFVKNRVEDTTTVASSIHAALKKNNDSSK